MHSSEGEDLVVQSVEEQERARKSTWQEDRAIQGLKKWFRAVQSQDGLIREEHVSEKGLQMNGGRKPC